MCSQSAMAQNLPTYRPNTLLVGLNDKVNIAQTRVLLSGVGRIEGSLPQLKAFRLKINDGSNLYQAVERLKASGAYRYVELDYQAKACQTSSPNDPYLSQQYALSITKTLTAWPSYAPQGSTVVAVVDTGIELTHPDLKNKLFKDDSGKLVGYDFQNGDSDPTDDQGHGTHCAGIIAAEANNGQGVAGVGGWFTTGSYVKLMPIKALGADGNGYMSTLAQGITYAADHGANVISMSFGGTSSSSTLSDAINYAWGKGCVLVAAAGNSSTTAYSFPAAYPNVISVASTDSTDTLSSFSNYGTWVLTAAPGSDIASTYLGGQYAKMSGTSMACPFVAGEVALLKAQVPSLSNSDLSNLVITNVDTYSPYVGRTGSGGRVNVLKALQAAMSSQTSSLSAVTVSPSSLVGGSTATITVTLSKAAPTGGAQVTLKSSDTKVTLPASVTVAAGATTGTASVGTTAVSERLMATLTASYLSVSKTCTLEVTAPSPELTSIAINPVAVNSGSSATLTVTLSKAAPVGGMTVTLTSSSSTVAAPSTVAVAAGATTGTATLTTSSVATSSTATLTAKLRTVTKSATLTVNPIQPVLSNLTLDPASVVGGKSANLTVSLSSVALSGGAVVTISSDSRFVKATTAITVPAGRSSATLVVTTSVVSADTRANFTATYAGTSKSATLTVTAPKPSVSSVTVNPSRLTSGASATLTVTLDRVAPTGGTTVTLSSNSATAPLPGSLVVPAGSKSASVIFTSGQVAASTSVTLGAEANAVKKTAVLTINPTAPKLASVTLDPSTIIGGKSANLLIALDKVAPQTGSAVSLKATTTGGTLSTTILIPAGKSSAVVQVTTSTVTTPQIVTLTAKLNDLSLSKILTVNPASKVSSGESRKASSLRVQLKLLSTK